MFKLLLRILLPLLLCGKVLFAESWTRKEARIRAGLILNIVRFTKYPQEKEHLYFCVLGSNPFKDVVDLIEKQKMKDQKILFQQLNQNINTASDCSVVFLAEDTEDTQAKILGTLKKMPVLTVASTKGFAQKGGLIEIFLLGPKLKFLVNRKEVQKADLKISSSRP